MPGETATVCLADSSIEVTTTAMYPSEVESASAAMRTGTIIESKRSRVHSRRTTAGRLCISIRETSQDRIFAIQMVAQLADSFRKPMLRLKYTKHRLGILLLSNRFTTPKNVTGGPTLG